jgi:phosphate transport system substrate-binding protein
MEAGCRTYAWLEALRAQDEPRFKRACATLREDGAYIEAGENDNLIVQKLANDPSAVGIFGYSYLEENASRLRGVSVNNVAPSYASISSFKYPGARALYIYVKNAHLQAIPGVRQLAAEYVKETSFGPKGYLAQAGLIASPDAARQRAARMATSMTPMNAAGLK